MLPLCGHCRLLVPVAERVRRFKTEAALVTLGAVVIRPAAHAAGMLKQLASFVVKTD